MCSLKILIMIGNSWVSRISRNSITGSDMPSALGLVIDVHEFVWNADITLIEEFLSQRLKYKIVSVLYQIVILQ